MGEYTLEKVAGWGHHKGEYALNLWNKLSVIRNYFMIVSLGSFMRLQKVSSFLLFLVLFLLTTFVTLPLN